jgi:hypothetical protein
LFYSQVTAHAKLIERTLANNNTKNISGGIEPSFVRKPKSLSVNSGSMVIIECRILSDPEPKVNVALLCAIQLVIQLSVYLDEVHCEWTDRMYFSVTNEGNIYSFTMVIDGVLMADEGMRAFYRSKHGP